jgi:hypothetical protein
MKTRNNIVLIISIVLAVLFVLALNAALAQRRPPKKKPLVCTWSVLMREMAEYGLTLTDQNPDISDQEFADRILERLAIQELEHVRYCRADKHDSVSLLEVTECSPAMPPNEITACLVLLADRRAYLSPRSLYWSQMRAARDKEN